MRTAAQIHEPSFPVEPDLLARRNCADQFGLVAFTHAFEQPDRFVARPDLSGDRFVACGDFTHPGLDRHQIFGREGALVCEVVVEPVLDDRADRHLRVGKQLLHRISEQVRGRVADHLDAVGVLVGDDRKVRVVLDAVAGVDQAAVDLAGQRCLGEARAYAAGDLVDRGRRRVLAA